MFANDVIKLTRWKTEIPTTWLNLNAAWSTGSIECGNTHAPDSNQQVAVVRMLPTPQRQHPATWEQFQRCRPSTTRRCRKASKTTAKAVSSRLTPPRFTRWPGAATAGDSRPARSIKQPACSSWRRTVWWVRQFMSSNRSVFTFNTNFTTLLSFIVLDMSNTVQYCGMLLKWSIVQRSIICHGFVISVFDCFGLSLLLKHMFARCSTECLVLSDDTRNTTNIFNTVCF